MMHFRVAATLPQRRERHALHLSDNGATVVCPSRKATYPVKGNLRAIISSQQNCETLGHRAVLEPPLATQS